MDDEQFTLLPATVARHNDAGTGLRSDPAPEWHSAESPRERGSAPRRPALRAIPFVTYSLLLVNFLVFAAMYWVGHGDVNSVADLFGDKNNALIRAGEIWRFVTPIFLHQGGLHLTMNCFSLYVFGTQMERIYGARKYFLIYMAAGIVGNLFSFVHSPNPSLGASGAIFGLVGAGIVFPLRFRSLVPEKARRQILFQLIVIAAINLGIGANVPGIDNAAHYGGLVGGGFVALFLMPNILRSGPRNRAGESALSAAVAVALVVTLWAAASQLRRATEDLAPVTETYTSGGPDPWWSIRTPHDWRPGPDPWSWQSPQDADIRLIDSAYNPQAVMKASSYFRQPAAHSDRWIIDGKVARHTVLLFPTGVNEFWLIPVTRQRSLLLGLECPANVYASTRKEFLAIVSSLRFVHSPDDDPNAAGKALSP